MIQTRDEDKVVVNSSRLALLGIRRRSERRLPGLRPEKRRLTPRFGRIENVINFDVEKWYNFNFLFAESFK